MTRKVCATPRCPVLVDAGAYRGLCDEHRRGRDRERGSREARGYGADHQQQRQTYVHAIERGDPVTCWRCHEQIKSVADLHLGHDDHDRSITRGPEHALCNLRAAGRSAHPS